MALFRLLAAAAFLTSANAVAAQPLIRPIMTPAPNARGWNNTEVVITFECPPAIVCPSAITVSADGTGQRLTRGVLDNNGRSVDANVVVNIDRTPPRISILSKPEPQTEMSFLDLTASMDDTGSGLQSAACNGRPARIADGIVRCTIALADGVNDVIVSATDFAGNSASQAVTVTRVGISRSVAIIPSVTTISVGAGQPLQLVDNFGRTVDDAHWTIDDPGVARVVTSPTLAVGGIGAGVATITAKSGALSAQIRVTVMNGPLPIGTTRWAIEPPLPGLKAAHMPRLRDIPDGPDMFFINTAAAGGPPVVITAMTETPRQLWIEQPAIAPSERIDKWMGDHAGGALLLLTRPYTGPVAIVRVGRPAFGSLWRYESAGRLSADWAMDWAGTLYVSETRAAGAQEIIGIDSNNGLAKFRVSVPHRRRITAACESILLGPPTIPDGMAAAYQFVVASDALQCPASGDKRWSKREVYLLRVQADGSSDETLLTDFQSPYPDPSPAITLFKVIPDAQGGMMAMMRIEMAGTAPINRVFYQSDSGTDSYSLPVMGETVTGHRWAFTSDGQTIIAFDPKTGRVGWSRTATAGEIHIRFAEEKGGVVVETIRGQEVLAADDGASRLLGPIFGDALPTKRR
jgi:hypothetical protein